ncbi:MAG: cyaB [Planctomycetota bacterium]|nr:cyaB [Planctomycetota bacterium]
MGYEVEIKFRVADVAALAEILARLGAEGGPEVENADLYLAHPSRDFAVTDEALRLRRVGQENRITYKGPKHGGPTKTREEIEIPFASDGEDLAQMTTLFERLGFRPVARVVKHRRTFAVEHMGRHLEVLLDHAGELGDFVEVETLAQSLADLPDAQAAVMGLATTLGLTEVEPRSYLRMTLERARP